jgi:hypothetical protein
MPAGCALTASAKAAAEGGRRKLQSRGSVTAAATNEIPAGAGSVMAQRREPPDALDYFPARQPACDRAA